MFTNHLIFNICLKKDLALNMCWYAIKPNQTKPNSNKKILANMSKYQTSHTISLSEKIALYRDPINLCVDITAMFIEGHFVVQVKSLCRIVADWREKYLYKLCIVSLKSTFLKKLPIYFWINQGGACGVMVIIMRNGHNNLSSKPGQSCLHLT